MCLLAKRYKKKKKIGRNNHLLSFDITRCHSLSLVVPLVVTRTTCCHSLSLVVTCCHSLYQSLPLVVPLVVIRCHSLSFDVSLVCLFINDPRTMCKISSKLTVITLERRKWRHSRIVFRLKMVTFKRYGRPKNSPEKWRGEKENCCYVKIYQINN